MKKSKQYISLDRCKQYKQYIFLQKNILDIREIEKYAL